MFHTRLVLGQKLSTDRKHPLRGHRLLGRKAAYNLSKFGPIRPIIKPNINVKAVKIAKIRPLLLVTLKINKDFQINRIP